MVNWRIVLYFHNIVTDCYVMDLILLDLLLLGIRGEEFCKKLKGDANLKHISVILFTASAGDIPKLAKEIGADDYIMKPFEPEELLEKVKKFIG